MKRLVGAIPLAVAVAVVVSALPAGASSAPATNSGIASIDFVKAGGAAAPVDLSGTWHVSGRVRESGTFFAGAWCVDLFSGTLKLSAGRGGVFFGPESLRLSYDRAASSSRCIQKVPVLPTETARVSVKGGRADFVFGLPGFEGASFVFVKGTSTRKIARVHGRLAFSTTLDSKRNVGGYSIVDTSTASFVKTG